MTAYSPLGSPHTQGYFRRGEDVPLLMQARYLGGPRALGASSAWPLAVRVSAARRAACVCLLASLPAPPAPGVLRILGGNYCVRACRTRP